MANNTSLPTRTRRIAAAALVLLGAALALLPSSTPTPDSRRERTWMQPLHFSAAAAPGQPTGIRYPGYTPEQIRKHMGLTPEQDGRGMAIAIVVAFHNPNVLDEVDIFSRTFSLPPVCRGSVTEGCFVLEVIQPQGRPDVKPEWSRESALDVQWAHAIAPRAKVVLVEAVSNDLDSLAQAIGVAARQPGVVVISNSWGGDVQDPILDRECTLTTAVCVFATGDHGMVADGARGQGTAAQAPHALSVGGTRLRLDERGDVLSEVAWSGSVGGLSGLYASPAYQTGVAPDARRSIPDVSFNADPSTGLAVVTIDGDAAAGMGRWSAMGGTSAGAPVWAGLIAVADQFRATPLAGATFEPQAALYEAAQGGPLFDVTLGANGTCARCSAGDGYDLVTGLGSPRPGVLQTLIEAPSRPARD